MHLLDHLGQDPWSVSHHYNNAAIDWSVFVQCVWKQFVLVRPIFVLNSCRSTEVGYVEIAGDVVNQQLS